MTKPYCSERNWASRLLNPNNGTPFESNPFLKVERFCLKEGELAPHGEGEVL